MNDAIQHLKDVLADHETLVIVSLLMIALCVIWRGSGEVAWQIVNSIVSGMIGYMSKAAK